MVLLFFTLGRPPGSTLFPYTTLFRSRPGSVSGPASGGVMRQYFPLRGHDKSRPAPGPAFRSEEHTSELQSRRDLVCRLLLEKKKKGRGTPRAGCSTREDGAGGAGSAQ